MSFWSDRGILKELPNDEWLLLETAEEVDPSKRCYYYEIIFYNFNIIYQINY